MTPFDKTLPRLRWRLLRTWLKRPRNVRRFATRVPYSEAVKALADSGEAARYGELVLLRDIVVALHRDGTITRLHHTISIPFAGPSLSQWDSVVRTFDSRTARFQIREAIVRLPDGSRRPAQRVVNMMNQHLRAITVTFSHLRPGVTIEFEEQMDFFRPDEVAPAAWSAFFLQEAMPCRRLRFTLAVASPFKAEVALHHSELSPKEWQDGDYGVQLWDVRNAPGIEADIWTPPARDYAPWVDVSTLPSWAPVSKHLFKDLEPPVVVREDVRSLAGTLTNSARTERDKASAIYQYLARDVRYGRHAHEWGIHKAREPGHVLDDLRGDCKDKSAMLVSMLRSVGIDARIAVVLTRHNGATPFLPANRFDHALVVAQIEGRPLWLDAAAGPYTFGELPANDQGVQALVLDRKEACLLDTPPIESEQHGITRDCRGDLDEHGNYAFRATVHAKGDTAAGFRIQYLGRAEDQRRRQLEQYVVSERPGTEVKEARFLDLEDLSRKVVLEYEAELRQWARPVQAILLFRVPWAEPIQFTGPMSAPRRSVPLATPVPCIVSERHEIRAPAGYHGYGLPYEVQEECDWISYACSVTFENGAGENGRLVCERKVVYRGGIVPTKRFAEYRKFWEACARSDAADVLLVRESALGSA